VQYFCNIQDLSTWHFFLTPFKFKQTW